MTKSKRLSVAVRCRRLAAAQRETREDLADLRSRLTAHNAALDELAGRISRLESIRAANRA